jgi:hypothetical protein
MNTSCTDKLIEALQSSSKLLIEEHWIVCWGYRSHDKPLSITIRHTIDPDAQGNYKLRTSIGFGIRLSYSQDAALPASAPLKTGTIAVAA